MRLLVALSLLLASVHAMLIIPKARADMAVEDLPAAIFGHDRDLDGNGLKMQQGATFDAGAVDDESKKKPKKKVPVVLGVMSKCPDAITCEATFDKIFSAVDSLVDLETVYIGSFNSSYRPYGVMCKHGSGECDGNVQQLCVREHTDTQKEWWQFVQCQNFESLSRIGDLSVAKQCAKVIGKPWDDHFSDCYTGKEGKQLLQESVETAHSMGIEKSCSIFINNRLACIHDGSWKECPNGHEPGDFEKLIKEEYRSINDLA